jgi:hypothetical protein
MPQAIYNTDVYFNNTYQDEWITDPLSVEIIKSVDKSDVLGPNAVSSPVLGVIPITSISGGAKTVILAAHDPNCIVNASACGNNCAKWLLKIAEDKDVTINLRHMMNFGKRKFTIKVLNNGRIVHTMSELIDAAGDFVWSVEQ